jgi:hypothetical protein
LVNKIGDSKENVIGFLGKKYFTMKEDFYQPNKKNVFYSSMKDEDYAKTKYCYSINLCESLLKGISFSILSLCFDKDERFLGSFILYE